MAIHSHHVPFRENLDRMDYLNFYFCFSNTKIILINLMIIFKFNLMFLKIILIGINIFGKKMPFKMFYLKKSITIFNSSIGIFGCFCIK